MQRPFLGRHGCACPFSTSALLPWFHTPNPALPPPSHLPRPPSRLSCFFPALRPRFVRPVPHSVHTSTPALFHAPPASLALIALIVLPYEMDACAEAPRAWPPLPQSFCFASLCTRTVKEHRIPIRFCFVPPPHLHSDNSLLVLTTKKKVFGAHPSLAECPSGSDADVGSKAGSDEAFAGLRLWFRLHEVLPTETPQEP